MLLIKLLVRWTRTVKWQPRYATGECRFRSAFTLRPVCLGMYVLLPFTIAMLVFAQSGYQWIVYFWGPVCFRNLSSCHAIELGVKTKMKALLNGYKSGWLSNRHGYWQTLYCLSGYCLISWFWYKATRYTRRCWRLLLEWCQQRRQSKRQTKRPGFRVTPRVTFAWWSRRMFNGGGKQRCCWVEVCVGQIWNMHDYAFLRQTSSRAYILVWGSCGVAEVNSKT